MKYKFVFNYKGTNYEKEIDAQSGKEMQVSHDVRINEFFPDIMEDKTFYKIKMIVFGKGVKEIHLSSQYGVNTKISNA